MLSYNGNDFNRYLKIKYSTTKEKLEILDSEEVEEKVLPCSIRIFLKSFYAKNLDKILKSSRLSDTEINRIVA